MYDSTTVSDSSEFEDAFNFCAQVTWMLDQGKSRESKWEFQGNLGLIIDLHREFTKLESGNTACYSFTGRSFKLIVTLWTKCSIISGPEAVQYFFHAFSSLWTE